MDRVVEDERIRVLLVEDNPTDAALIRAMVRDKLAAGIQFEWEHADRLSAGLARLNAETFDVLLLDMGLPDSEGLDTFITAQKHAPALPIVLLTGFDDEERALAALQAGAQDYLVKDQIDGDSLLRAMRYAIERKQVQMALQKARDELEERVTERTAALHTRERRFREIFQTAAVPVMLEDYSAVKAEIDRLKAEGIDDFESYFDQHPEFVKEASRMVKIVGANRATLRIYGVQSLEDLLQTLDTIFVPETLAIFREVLLAIVAGKSLYETETINQTLQGERRNVLLAITLPTETEDFDRVVVSLMDITERKQAEQALEANLDKMQALYHVTQSVSARLSLPERLQAITDTVAEALPADRVTLTTLDLKAQQVEHFVSGGRDADKAVRLSYTELMEGLSGWTIRELKPALSPKDRPHPHDTLPAQRREEGKYGAVLIVPLSFQKRSFGTLTAVNRPDRRDFNEQDVDLMMAIASQVATAIQNAELYEAERQARQAAETLRAATLAFTRTLEMNAVMETLLDHLKEVVPYDSANVMLLETGNMLVMRGVRGYDRWTDTEAVHGLAFAVDRSPHLQQVIQKKESLIVEDTQNFPTWEHRPGTEYIRNWMVVPLVAGGNAIGLYSVDKAQPGFFTEAHLRLAESLAAQASIAIQNAKLFAESQRRAEEVTAVSGILHALNAVTDVREAFPVITASLRAMTSCERISLALFDDEQNRATVVELDRPHVELGRGSSFPLSDSYATQNILAGRPHLADDIRVEKNYPIAQTLLEAGYLSSINLPLVTSSQVIGMFNLAWIKEAGFNVDQLPLLEQVAGAIGLAVEKNRLFNEVQQLAVTDDLTGLHNRRNFFALGEREMERLRRYGRPLAAIMIDIDHFKKVNDTHGHTVGDEVLSAVAACLQNNVRTIDILGRYGGEEFIVLLPETEIEEANQMAERLRVEVAGTSTPHPDGPISVTISLGVAIADAEASNIDQLVEQADTAMYASKQAGRNQVVTIEESEQ